MKNDLIKLGESYYGYDCADNGEFRLLRYHITSKRTYSCEADLYQVGVVGSRLLGKWMGYPDNLYLTKEDAIKALKKSVGELEERIFPEKAPVNLVNPVHIMACCETCRKFNPNTSTCLQKTYKISDPGFICKEGHYECDFRAIDKAVKEVQNR